MRVTELDSFNHILFSNGRTHLLVYGPEIFGEISRESGKFQRRKIADSWLEIRKQRGPPFAVENFRPHHRPAESSRSGTSGFQTADQSHSGCRFFPSTRTHTHTRTHILVRMIANRLEPRHGSHFYVVNLHHCVASHRRRSAQLRAGRDLNPVFVRHRFANPPVGASCTYKPYTYNVLFYSCISILRYPYVEESSLC